MVKIMQELPSLSNILYKTINDGKILISRSLRNHDGALNTITVVFDKELGRFVNGSVKTVKVKNGVRNAWRQNIFATDGYGTCTHVFDRGDVTEALKHRVSPNSITGRQYFSNPLKSGDIHVFFPEDEFGSLRGNAIVADLL